MTKHSPEKDDAGHPLPRSEKVSRVVQSLANSTFGTTDANGQEYELSEEAVRTAVWSWRERAAYLPPDLLSDPVWGMLLELLQGEVSKRPVLLSALCKASTASTTVAVRWLKVLEDRNLVTRRVDHLGRDFVELTWSASAALRRYFRNVVQSR